MMNEIIDQPLPSAIKHIFKESQFKNTLLVTGKNSYEISPYKTYFETLKSKFNIAHVVKTDENPAYDEIYSCLNQLKFQKIDFIIAFGGGSVIDFAKCISLYQKSVDLFQDFASNFMEIELAIPLIAIPTTSGSGSESTSFAVLYKDKRKYSISNPILLPDYVILDEKNTYSHSPYFTACSGIDALCQSIESLWAVNKTNESQEYALTSIKLLVPNLIRCFRGENKYRNDVMLGATYSGKAINISKTTAPHAFSYYLTTFHGINHGEAVAINFERFIDLNFEFINKQRELLEIFEVKTKNELIEKFSILKTKLGLMKSLSDIDNLHIDRYLDYINLERLSNNPVKMDLDEAKGFLKKSYLKK